MYGNYEDGEMAEVQIDGETDETLFIESGSPWENGYNESFYGKLHDEPLNGEIFYMQQEAMVLIERWHQHYNIIRPHSALGYNLPAPAAIVPQAVTSNALKLSRLSHSGWTDELGQVI